MNSILFVAASATSLGVIGRDASEIAVSPAQNRLKPPPVPEIPTVTLTPSLQQDLQAVPDLPQKESMLLMRKR